MHLCGGGMAQILRFLRRRPAGKIGSHCARACAGSAPGELSSVQRHGDAREVGQCPVCGEDISAGQRERKQLSKAQSGSLDEQVGLMMFAARALALAIADLGLADQIVADQIKRSVGSVAAKRSTGRRRRWWWWWDRQAIGAEVKRGQRSVEMQACG